MMCLGDFSTLFEIAATLNMAYIAVDYSTAFTISVAKNVFRFHDKITSGINRCKKHIDEATINSINDINLNGLSVACKIEKVKIDSSKLSKEINLLEPELKTYIEEKCRLTCFSSICLQLFLYCIVACFVMGYSDNLSSSTYWSFFITLSAIYTSLIFYIGEIKGKFIDFYQSVKCNSIVFVFLCLTAWVLTTLTHGQMKTIIDYIWDWIVPLSALYPFLFFVLFILLLKRNSKTVVADIETQIDRVEQKCIDLEGEVSKLVYTHELYVEVEGLSATPAPPQRQIPAPKKGKNKPKKK